MMARKGEFAGTTDGYDRVYGLRVALDATADRRRAALCDLMDHMNPAKPVQFRIAQDYDIVRCVSFDVYLCLQR